MNPPSPRPNHSMPRRRFFSGSMCAAGAAMLPWTARFARDASGLPADFFGTLKLHMLDLAHFEKHLNSRFTLELGAGERVELTLTEAVAGSQGSSQGETLRRAPFSLIFRGPVMPGATQRIYRLEHPVLGVLEVFLVPVGRTDQGLLWEAVFN